MPSVSAWGSILGHPWPAAQIAKAQKLVNAFLASSKLLGYLNDAAKQLNITVGLASSNKTRFNSVHTMLESVRTNELSLGSVARQYPGCLKEELVVTIMDRFFWSDL